MLEIQAKQHLILICESLLMIYQTVDHNGENIKVLYEKIFDSIGLIMQNG
jgi:hypothetical protein